MPNRNKEKDIFKALKNGEIEKIKALIDSGIDVNVQDKNGSTALISAAGKGHAEITKELVKSGADINIKDKYGKTALEKGHNEIMEILEKKGKEIK